LHLAHAIHSKPSAGLPRCQDLPPKAFFPPSQAAELFDNSAESVRKCLVLSYGWRMGGNPDPDGRTIDAVMRFLKDRLTEKEQDEAGMFLDFAALPQKA
jgi:hypothetical protein